VEDAPQVVVLVDEVIKLSHEKYAAMNPFDFAGLKQTLCRFFADKRVKVSLFLQDGIQKNDGTITLSYAGALPPGIELPGRISYYDISGAGLGSDSFDYPLVESITPESFGPPIDAKRQAACTLGQNLYSKDKAATPPAAAAAAAAAIAGAAAHHGASSQPQLDSAAAERAILANSDSHARQDLNLLADLIGSAAADQPFKLNLFPETAMPDGTGGRGVVGATQMIVIDVGGRELNAANRDLVGVMDDMHLGGDPGYGQGRVVEDDDDLLGLMDSAGADDPYRF